MKIAERNHALNKNVTFPILENSLSAIPIEIDLHESFVFNEPIKNLDFAFKLIEKKLPEIEAIAHEAFNLKNKNSWAEVQKILYSWNIDEIFRKNIISDYRFIIKSALRNKIIEIEEKNKEPQSLTCMSNFTIEKAVKELADKARAHRINSHPLLMELDKTGLNQKAVRNFLDNYYVNNRLFHLFIAVINLFTPLEQRTDLACNFYDELGAGDSSMAHPVIFLKNYDWIGKSKIINPIPESLHLANSKFYAAFLSGNYHYAMGGFGFIELTMPDQMTKILNGLRKSGLKEDNLEFWRIHINIDIQHGQNWFEEMRKLISSPEEALTCLKGGIALLDARATMYDGILNSTK